MRFIRYITFLLYSYYLRGPRDSIAYFSAIASLTFITLVHLFILFLLFKVDKNIPGFSNPDRKLTYFIIFLIGLPFFLFYHFLIKEKKIIEMKESFGYGHFDKEFNHRILLFSYIILLFISLTVLILMR